MARRDVSNASEAIQYTEEELREAASNDSYNEVEREEGLLELNTDFDLGAEYKPTPIMKAGKYRGNVVGVAFDKAKHSIAWKICMDRNEGMMMSDGETQLDGAHFYFHNWLPKPGDADVMQSNGRVTKRQGKINSMTKFSKAMGIEESMKTPRAIAEAITNAEWIGIPVLVDMTVDEYQGEFNNKLNNMCLDATPE